MAYKARRLFKPKKGLDLKSAETMRGEDHLSYADNVVYSDQGEIAKRPGTQLRVYGINSYSGMTLFETTDYKGVSKSEIVFVGTNAGEGPRRVIKRYLNIANATGSTVTANCVYNPTLSRYELRLTGGATATVNLGTGLVGGDLTIAGLIATVVAGITFSSASSIGTVPAAFMENKTETILNGGNANFAYYSTEEIPYGGYGTEPSFTPVFPRSNPTTALINGSLYWYGTHTGTQTPLLKYDGHSWYGAGLPQTSNPGATFGTAGQPYVDSRGSGTVAAVPGYTTSTGSLFWYRLMYKDKTGSLHYGDFKKADHTAGTGLTTNPLIFITNDAPADIRYCNIRLARTSQVHAGVLTLNVDAGHTIAIGDVAYFWDSVQLKFIEREVTNIGATSITISGTAITAGDVGGVVSTNDDASISNNFRVQWFYANELINSPGIFSGGADLISNGYLMAEVPYGIFNLAADEGSILFWEKNAVAAAYAVTPYTYQYNGNTSYPPPKGKFVAGANNGSSLLISGNIESDNTVYSSSSEDTEAFFIGRNAFTVDGTVTGLGSSGATTFVATAKQTYAVQGDIPNLNFRVEKVTENLGVIAPASVCEIDEGAIHFNTIKGPFMLLGGRELKPVGEWPLDKRVSVIEPYFTYTYTPRSALVYQPSFEVASAYVIKEKKWIILNIPWNASSTFSYLYTGAFVYDYSMGGWFTWSGIDSTCGAVYWDDKVWLAGQGAGGTINLVSMQNPTVATNYHDHGAAIAATVRYHWENGGDINSYKKFLWLTVYSPPGNGSNYVYNVKTYVNYETASSNSWKVPTAQHTSFTATATPPAYTVETKLKSGKFASIMVEISNSTTQQGMWISGTELDIAPTYKIPSRPGRSDT